jgi:hypothetical protein
MIGGIQFLVQWIVVPACCGCHYCCSTTRLKHSGNSLAAKSIYLLVASICYDEIMTFKQTDSSCELSKQGFVLCSLLLATTTLMQQSVLLIFRVTTSRALFPAYSIIYKMRRSLWSWY